MLGTSRGDGNTAKALAEAFPSETWIDLAEQQIAPYDYLHRHDHTDDFLTIAQQMTNAADIVLATPVYWYAMSGQMKLFIDRWSDLVTVRKDLGRGLAGRRLWALATSADPEFPPGFEEPFRLTARYLDMKYREAIHVQMADKGGLDAPSQARLRAFGDRVRAAA